MAKETKKNVNTDKIVSVTLSNGKVLSGNRQLWYELWWMTDRFDDAAHDAGSYPYDRDRTDRLYEFIKDMFPDEK